MVQRVDRVASPESGHLASSPWLYQRMVSPFFVHWGFSPIQKKYCKKTVHSLWSLTKELTTCFALSEPPERKSRGIMIECLKRGAMYQGLFFLPLFKLKRSANVTSIWTLHISVETLVCRRMEGTIPPPDTTRGRDSVWTLCWNQSIRTQGPMGQEVSGFFSTPQ